MTLNNLFPFGMKIKNGNSNDGTVYALSLLNNWYH